ncbi:hypothetical protein ECANGB1_128 [Enterospora canceri]|uniref:MI domain-containing protein n=1 Tax=Enterospora canceri TaxID=1081671 RepID=A0A1Y1S8B4_9MICR|nr:hypothetical protein ECANGB1_128 [Enterospora canceri]
MKNKEDELEKFRAPVVKNIKPVGLNRIKTEYEIMISLYKQPSQFKTLLRRILNCSDVLVAEHGQELLEKLLNIMIGGCCEDKLFYKAVKKLSQNVEENTLRKTYRTYAMCMLQKWQCDYKFAFFVKNRFNGIFNNDSETLKRILKNKGVLGRLLNTP